MGVLHEIRIHKHVPSLEVSQVQNAPRNKCVPRQQKTVAGREHTEKSKLRPRLWRGLFIRNHSERSE